MIIYGCSSNAGKLREFALAAAGFELPKIVIEPLPKLAGLPAPEENGATFEENASAKALYYSEFTPELVLADDSGLEVEALNGAPGVYSARYAGPEATDEENNRLLLRNLEFTAQRRARFVCALSLARAGRILNRGEGMVEGEILEAARGAGGFGYDPLFYYAPLGRTFAELTLEEKFAVSHRGRALRMLLAQLGRAV